MVITDDQKIQMQQGSSRWKNPVIQADQKIGKIMKARREELNMSQLEVAKKIGVTAGEFISMIESGVRMPDMDRIPKIARALELDAQVFLKIFLQQNHPVAYQTLFPGKPAPKSLAVDPEDIVFNEEDIEILDMLNTMDPHGKDVFRQSLYYAVNTKYKKRD